MFIPKYNLSSEKNVTDKFLIKNSITVSVGDVVDLTAGQVDLGDASTTAILGVVVAIVNEDGTPIVTDGTAGSQVGSYKGTFLTASDNATVAKVMAVVNTSRDQVYQVELDADAGTTSGSDVIGALFDLAGPKTIDESTVGAGPIQVIGFDPDVATTVFAKIAVSAITR